MQAKNFNDDFLESSDQEKQKLNPINFKELKENSEGHCDYFFQNLENCKEFISQNQKEMCEKLQKNLLFCLKTFGKYYE